jgi:hypothetical protein
MVSRKPRFLALTIFTVLVFLSFFSYSPMPWLTSSTFFTASDNVSCDSLDLRAPRNTSPVLPRPPSLGRRPHPPRPPPLARPPPSSPAPHRPRTWLRRAPKVPPIMGKKSPRRRPAFPLGPASPPNPILGPHHPLRLLFRAPTLTPTPTWRLARDPVRPGRALAAVSYQAPELRRAEAAASRRARSCSAITRTVLPLREQEEMRTPSCGPWRRRTTGSSARSKVRWLR